MVGVIEVGGKEKKRHNPYPDFMHSTKQTAISSEIRRRKNEGRANSNTKIKRAVKVKGIYVAKADKRK